MQTVGAATYCALMAETPIAPSMPFGSAPTGATPSAAAPATSPPSTSALRRALRRVRDGVALDVTEASVLLAARGEQLDELLAAAARVRDAGLVDAGRPGVVTYSRKVFVPLTRLCRDRCHYCTFATVPHRLPAAFLERDEVLEIARAGRGRRAARRRCSPSATGPRSAGPPRASGWRPAATTPRWSTCARARSPCWRRPVCCPTSTPAS